MYRKIIGRKGYDLSNRFNSIFSTAFPGLQTTMCKASNGWLLLSDDEAGSLLYKWVGDNIIWIGAPGCTKDDIKTTAITDNKLCINWDTKFSKADVQIPLIDGTKNVEIDVINGMIVVTFQTGVSDISVTIK